MKKWDKPTVFELGLEKTKESDCNVNFTEAGTYTAYPVIGKGCIWNDKYEPGVLGVCKHYDCKAPGKCKLNISKIS